MGFGFFAHAGPTAEQAADTVKIIGSGVSDFEVDNLGNVFVLNAQQQIKKLNAQFDSIGLFNEVRRYGNLYSIDASNPLKVLLFFKDFGTVVVLDRFLGIRSVIDLRRLGIVQATAVAQSYDNNLWVFDELDSKLKKLSESGSLLLESAELRLVLAQAPRPVALVDYNKHVYAYDADMGLLVFDYFGAYKNVVEFYGWKNLHGFSKGIMATQNNSLVYYQPGAIDTKLVPLPKLCEGAKKVLLHEGRLLVLLANGQLIATDFNTP
ncbi:MAG: hypothetical protein EAY75_15245 [Bacteroidetes bacterium]|nr:MAG: hypothetical protein EAY75_15245 [Bacteroidota bacterium]